MAYMDAQLALATTQTVAADDTETISENIVDLTSASRDPGAGRPAYLKVLITTAINQGTVTFNLYEHTAATSVTSGNVILSFARASTALTAGTEIVIPIPPGQIDEQYLGLSYANDESSGNTGAFSAWIDLG